MVTARGGTVGAAEALIVERAALGRARLGEAVYGENDDPIEKAVVDLLEARRQTVSTAESCTGGLVAQRITDVAGSSAVFVGGVVAYSNAVKTAFVDVPAEMLERVGAVSPEVGQAHAEGACRRFGPVCGIGSPGVAGPGRGTAANPGWRGSLRAARSGGGATQKG